MATSHINGQYSILTCVEILKNAKKRLLNGQQFSYVLEMRKDEQNRVLLISLKDYTSDLIKWSLYKYEWNHLVFGLRFNFMFYVFIDMYALSWYLSPYMYPKVLYHFSF